MICPDCNADVGELHEPGCDVERCRLCGGQAISCRCEEGAADDGGIPVEVSVEMNGGRLPWAGAWPGELECAEFGLWCYENPGGDPWWVPCDPEHPDAGPDLNRLFSDRGFCWSAEQGRWVRRAA